MKLTELHEGLMKRSDPYISGERSGPRPTQPSQGTTPPQPAQPAKPKQPAKPAAAKTAPGAKPKSLHQQNINTLSQKSKLPPEQVQKTWDEEKTKVASNHPNRWALVMNNVKKRLRVS